MKKSLNFLLFHFENLRDQNYNTFNGGGGGILHVHECDNLWIKPHPLLIMPWGPVAGTV